MITLSEALPPNSGYIKPMLVDGVRRYVLHDKDGIPLAVNSTPDWSLINAVKLELEVLSLH